MKERRLDVAIIDGHKVSHITVTDRSTYRDPLRQVLMVDLEGKNPRPKEGWLYARGQFFDPNNISKMTLEFSMRARI